MALHGLQMMEVAMSKYAQKICGPTLTLSALAVFVILATLIPA